MLVPARMLSGRGVSGCMFFFFGWAAAVRQQFLVVAARVEQGIRQDRQAVEGALFLQSRSIPGTGPGGGARRR